MEEELRRERTNQNATFRLKEELRRQRTNQNAAFMYYVVFLFLTRFTLVALKRFTVRRMTDRLSVLFVSKKSNLA